MIIVCPECSGPYELPDDRISALVQLQCPHCEYRVILDFAAANDPSLIEEGMQMASGFRSAVDYRASLAPAPRAPLRPVEQPPELAPVPAGEPAAPTAVPLRPTAPASARGPRTSPAARTRTAAAKQPRTGKTVVGPLPGPPGSGKPVGPLPEAEVEEPSVEALDVEDEAAPESVPTVPIAEPDVDLEPAPEPEPAVAQTEIRETVEVEAPAAAIEAERAPAPSRQPAVEAKQPAPAEERPPPHTPPAPRAATAAAEAEPKPVPEPSDSVELELPRSGAGTFLLAVLVLLAVALVGASVAMKGTPDPRPLLEDVLRNM